MPKISVIMPCLNMERYIAESLESVLSQTLEEIEVLVIDAGSIDRTVEIIKQYMCIDKRIRLLHSDKKSYGYQVNMGIGIATGEYIAIVDTDDRIMPDMYETLYPIAVESGADYVKGTADLFYTMDGGYIYRIHLPQFDQVQYRDGAIEVVPCEMPELLMRDSFLWYGIYKNSFFKNIVLNETPGAAYQDAGGVLQTFVLAKKAVYVDKTVYEYRQDNLGASEYNPKAFSLICKEYECDEKFVENQSVAWKRVFNYKFFAHTMTRFPVMVVSGGFWEEGLSSMQNIARRLDLALKEQIIGQKDFQQKEWEQLQIFLENPKELYYQLELQYRESQEMMRTLLFHIQKSQVVIFGSGKFGAFLVTVALYNQVDTICAFCDSSVKRQGKTIYGREIFSPQEAVKRYPEAIYVVANKNYCEEMKIELLRLGIKEERIDIYSSGIDVKFLRNRLL